MTGLDINGHRHHQYDLNDDKANISVKHIRHHDQPVSDQLQTSTSSYQEEYVPPVDTPILEPYNPNASNIPPKNKSDPGTKFHKNFQNDLKNVPASTLRSIAKTPQQARAMLEFAYHNPDVPVDPEVRALVNSLIGKLPSRLKSKRTRVPIGNRPLPIQAATMGALRLDLIPILKTCSIKASQGQMPKLCFLPTTIPIIAAS